MLSLPIGVFDSGIGGFSVLKKLFHDFPHENFVYLADTARVPYGEKDFSDIQAYSLQAIHWMRHNLLVKCLVIACHTSSVTVLSLKNDFPILGTVKPTLGLIKRHLSKKILFLATQATVRSRIYGDLLDNNFDKSRFSQMPCPQWAPFIESLEGKKSDLSDPVKSSVEQFPHSLDVVILGCTHYPLIAPLIQRYLPHSVHLMDPSEQISLHLAQTLREHQLCAPSSQSGNVRFFCTGDPLSFQKKISFWLSLKKIPVQKAVLDFF